METLKKLCRRQAGFQLFCALFCLTPTPEIAKTLRFSEITSTFSKITLNSQNVPKFYGKILIGKLCEVGAKNREYPEFLKYNYEFSGKKPGLLIFAQKNLSYVAGRCVKSYSDSTQSINIWTIITKAT